MNFENGGQLGKLQQLADEMTGGSQLDRAVARLRRQGNRYECSEASGIDHFHAAEVDHDLTGLPRKLGNFARQRRSFNAISDSALAADHGNVVGYSDFGIGDTLSEDPKVVYDEIPRFAPECFARFSNPNPSKYKPFAKGLEQMLREGVVREDPTAQIAMPKSASGARRSLNSAHAISAVNGGVR